MPCLSQILSAWLEQALGPWYPLVIGLVVDVTIMLDSFLCLALLILILTFRPLTWHR